MAWNYVHNFPAAEDEFTAPIDYPAVGWQKIISTWWQDLVTAIKAIQQAFLAYLGEHGGDPDDFPFKLASFTTDGVTHLLNISAVVPEGYDGVTLNVRILDDAIGSYVAFQKPGLAHIVNAGLFRTQIANIHNDAELDVLMDTERRIAYQTSNTTFTGIDVSIRKWWRL